MLAERCSKSTSDLDTRLTQAFRRVLCRAPADADLVRLRRAYERQFGIYKADVAGAQALLSVGAAKRDEKLDASEQAAFTAVCLAILNFDEALTRE